MNKGLYQKLDSLPDNLKTEVEYFVDFLLTDKEKKLTQSKKTAKSRNLNSVAV